MAAQTATGGVRVLVQDASGNPLSAELTLRSMGGDLERTISTGSDGTAELRSLPFGSYLLSASQVGYRATQTRIDVHSAVPQLVNLALPLASLQQYVDVTGAPTAVPTDPETRAYISQQQIQSYQTPQVGRAGPEMVALQPGWLMEGNGVLHPRGSEYQTQWIVDGIPVTDNRSAAFAPAPGLSQTESLTVWTAGYPAEYGRKLGGVINVVSEPSPAGLQTQAALTGGSFNNIGGALALSYGARNYSAGGSFSFGQTDRFLDPPALENYHNVGQLEDGLLWLDLDPTSRDRLRFSFNQSSLEFQIPNLPDQQTAGQEQYRSTAEFSGAISYQRVLGPKALLNARFSMRDLETSLDANLASTPIIPRQQRGFLEGYGGVSLSWIKGRQEWTAGADLLLQSLHENFNYLITDPSQFDPSLPLSYAFTGQAHDAEPAVYVQDRITFRNLTVQAGIRFDAYNLLVHDHAVSPRLAAVWYSEKAGLSVHASYDRVFQTPASENLLLSSSFSAQHLTSDTAGLPVLPSWANFFEAGISKELWARSLLDVSWFDRRGDNFADDDIFLNTGISFPIAFSRSQIYGVEAKLRLPTWKRFSAEGAYSYLVGRALLPVTGGLLLQDADTLLNSHYWIPITQDQRNTANLNLRYQTHPRLWFSALQSYASGLPFQDAQVQGTDPRILAAVNLDRQRVRPFYSLDVQCGAELIQSENRELTLEGSVFNVFDRLHVIDFAGALSDTALGLPRSYALTLRFRNRH